MVIVFCQPPTLYWNLHSFPSVSWDKPKSSLLPDQAASFDDGQPRLWAPTSKGEMKWLTQPRSRLHLKQEGSQGAP